ncbi:MAG: hypothetical protein MZV64_43965 [Ignavibacteriales bacterium]|nr:hypothetical protein [Ignavibacteriales bacterium]
MASEVVGVGAGRLGHVAAGLDPELDVGGGGPGQDQKPGESRDQKDRRESFHGTSSIMREYPDAVGGRASAFQYGGTGPAPPSPQGRNSAGQPSPSRGDGRAVISSPGRKPRGRDQSSISLNAALSLRAFRVSWTSVPCLCLQQLRLDPGLGLLERPRLLLALDDPDDVVAEARLDESAQPAHRDREGGVLEAA